MATDKDTPRHDGTRQLQAVLYVTGLLTLPQEHRLRDVADVRRVKSTIFPVLRSTLDAELWLINTTDLLKAARHPEREH